MSQIANHRMNLTVSTRSPHDSITTQSLLCRCPSSVLFPGVCIAHADVPDSQEESLSTAPHHAPIEGPCMYSTQRETISSLAMAAIISRLLNEDCLLHYKG